MHDQQGSLSVVGIQLAIPYPGGLGQRGQWDVRGPSWLILSGWMGGWE